MTVLTAPHKRGDIDPALAKTLARRDLQADEVANTVTGAFYEYFDLNVRSQAYYERGVAKFNRAIDRGLNPADYSLHDPTATVTEAAVWRALDNPRPDAIRLVRLNGFDAYEQMEMLERLNEKFILHAENDPQHQEPLYLTREALYALEMLREDRQMNGSIAGLDVTAHTMRLPGPEFKAAIIDNLGQIGQAVKRNALAIASPQRLQSVADRVNARFDQAREVLSLQQVQEILSLHKVKAAVAAGAAIVAAGSMAISINSGANASNQSHASARLPVTPIVQTYTSTLLPTGTNGQAPDITQSASAPSLTGNLIATAATELRVLEAMPAMHDLNRIDRNALGQQNDKLSTFQSIFMATDILQQRDILKDGLAGKSGEDLAELFSATAKVETGFDIDLHARHGVTADAAAGLMQVKAPEMAIKMMQFQPQLRDVLGEKANAAVDGMFDHYLNNPHVLMASKKRVERLRAEGITRGPKQDTGILRDVYERATPAQKAAIRELRTDESIVMVNGMQAPRGGVLTTIAAASLSDEVHIDAALEQKHGIAPLRYLLHQNGETRFRAMDDFLAMDATALANNPKMVAEWQHKAMTHAAAKNGAIWMTAAAQERHRQAALDTRPHHKKDVFHAADVALPDALVQNVNQLIANAGRDGRALYKAHKAGAVLEADATGDLKMRAHSDRPVMVAAARQPVPAL